MTEGQEVALAYLSLVPSMKGTLAGIQKDFKKVEGIASRSSRQIGRDLTASIGRATRGTKEFAVQAGKAAANFSKGFTTRSTDGLAASLGNLGRVGADTFGGLAKKIPGVTKGIDLAKNAAFAAARPFTNFATGFFQSATAAASSFTGTMGTLGGKTASAIGAVSQKFTEFRAVGGNLAKSVIANNAALSATTSVVRNLGGVLPGLTRGFTGLAGSVGSALSGTLSAVGSFTSSAASMIARIPGKIADVFRGPATAAVTAGLAGLTVALTKGFGRLSSIDTAQAKLRGLGHDADNIKSIMTNALTSVKGTSFGLGEAATIAASAVAASIKPGVALETHLKRIANNASAAGVSMGEMGSIFNKAATQANGVQNDVIGQLADRGIPIYAELGKRLGVTAGEVFKLASEGKVNFETFSKAAEAAAGTVAQEIGKTVPGAAKNFIAAVGRVGANLWAGFTLDDGTYTGIYGKLASLIQAMTAALDPVEALAKRAGNAIGVTLGPVLDSLTAALNSFGAAGESAGERFKPLLSAVAPFGAMLAALGAGGLAGLISKLGPLAGLLGPLPGLLGAIGAPVGIAAAGLFALTQIDPQAMLGGFTQILGALPGMFAGIAPALTGLMVNVLPAMRTALLDNLPILIQGVTQVVQILVVQLSDLSPNLIEAGVVLFTGLVHALTTVVPTLIQSLVSTIKNLLPVIVGLVPTLIQGALQLFAGLVQALTLILPPLIQGIVELLPAIVGALVSLVPQLVGGAVLLLTGIVDAIPMILPPLLEGIIGLLPIIVGALVSLVPQLITGALTLLMALVQAIPMVIPPLLEGVLGLLPEILTALISMIPVLIEGAVQLFTGIVQAIPIILPTLLTAIIDLIPVVVTTLVSMIDILVQGAVQLFTGIIDALPIVIPALIDAVIAIGPQLVTAIINMIPLLFQAGKDLIGGLIGGIGDMAGGAVDAVTDLGGKMLGGIKSFFGIKSPSTVMAKIGGFLDSGLAGGIGKGAGSAAAMAAMAKQITAITTGLQRNVTGTANTVSQQVNRIIVSLRQLMSMMSGAFRSTIAGQLNMVAALFRTLLPAAVTQMVAKMRAGLGGLQTWVAGAFKNGLISAVNAIKLAFLAVPSAVATSWAKLKPGTAAPTNFVISAVYMNGIRSAVNAITSAAGVKMSMPSVKTVAYAGGGILPGYTPGRDIYTFHNPAVGSIRLSGGEAILRPEVTRALGPATINAWNASRGRDVHAYAKGGIVNFLTKGTSGWSVNAKSDQFLAELFGDVKSGLTALITAPAKEYAARSGGGQWGAGAGGSMTQLAGLLTAALVSKVNAAKPSEEGLPAGTVTGGPPGAFNPIGWQMMSRIIKGAFPGATITSAYRPGNGPSMHNYGRAVDIASGNMVQIAEWLLKTFPNSYQVLHSPLGARNIWWAGQRGMPPGYLMSTHYDHVHWAMKQGGIVPELFDNGGWITPGLHLLENKTRSPEAVFTQADLNAFTAGRGDVYINQVLIDPTKFQTYEELFTYLRGLGLDLAMAGGGTHG